MALEATSPLSPEEASRLAEFARACKAAARAVVLYPGNHPAIGVTLGRIVHVTSAASLPAPMRMAVLPDALLINDRAPAREEPAIAELAALLHQHLIIELTVHPGGDADDWRRFLSLLGRSPESVRAEGGISRVWATMVGRHVEIQEVDYAEVLRERAGGESATWERIIHACLRGEAFELDDASRAELLRLAEQADQLGALVATLEARAQEAAGGLPAKTASVLRMLRGIVGAVSRSEPERAERLLRNVASAVGQFSPDTIVELISAPRDSDQDGHVMDALVSRMGDSTIAGFVARHASTDGGATSRLAEAFHALVRSGEERQRLLTLAHDEAARSPFGRTDDFETAWNDIAQKLLTSYSDQAYVSDPYGRELSGARTHAVAVEQAGDDPPERISAWLNTVATSALRELDLALLLDLLRLEADDARWAELMPPVSVHIEELLFGGDFEAAGQLLGVLVGAAAPGGSDGRRQHALIAIDDLTRGLMLPNIVGHLQTIDDVQFERVKAICVSLGETMVRPLAEALSAEHHGRVRERLTSILLSFGNMGRRAVERLKSSPNAAVRRTAIYLMRAFGGTEALPDLTELLDDSEPRVQREAVRAILDIGTDAAYRVLEQALSSSTARTRDAIMQSLAATRHERATPLYAYILRHIDHRGPLAAVYLRAIEGLGGLRDPEGVGPLREALYKGEWWSPRRTRELRGAAAAALARIGTPEARAVLDEAAGSRSRGVRSAARAYASMTSKPSAPPSGTA